MTATANYSGATIIFDSIALDKVGSWSYRVVLTAESQTFNSNSATLTVTNPCLGTTINDQTINFSSLEASYDETISLNIPTFSDSVDQNPIYGTLGS